MKKWSAEGLPSVEDAKGDPWFVSMHDGKVSAEAMQAWVKDRYVFRGLYALAWRWAGATDQNVAFNMHSADKNGGALSKFELGRIRRYVKACLGY